MACSESVAYQALKKSVSPSQQSGSCTVIKSNSNNGVYHDWHTQQRLNGNQPAAVSNIGVNGMAYVA